MKTAVSTLGLAFLAACLSPVPAKAQDTSDIDKLYAMVQQARAELQALRIAAGISGGEEASREGREGGGEHEGREGRERRGEHEGREGRERRGEHGGEGREGRGEHGEGGEEGGEEGGVRVSKSETWDNTRNGAHLVLAYNPTSQSFKGTVRNASSRTLSEVRVEVHLSNGTELGPTKRIDLPPGQSIPVELAAGTGDFEWWTTHPEHGSEEGHGGEGEEGGEHGEGGESGDDNRPTAANLRPLYNQLLLLQREVELLKNGMKK